MNLLNFYEQPAWKGVSLSWKCGTFAWEGVCPGIGEAHSLVGEWDFTNGAHLIRMVITNNPW